MHFAWSTQGTALKADDSAMAIMMGGDDRWHKCDYYIQMQASVLKELARLPAFNAQLGEYLRSLQRISFDNFSQQGLKIILSGVASAACQTRNLLHYRHLQQRSAAEKCFLLAQELSSKIVKDHPQLLDHVANELLTHVQHHPSCYVSIAFSLLLARTHKMALSKQKLAKALHKVIACFQEAGEIKFLKEIAEESRGDWQTARNNLEAHLSGKFKPQRRKEGDGEVNVSLTKIPPLILPSLKSINSSRYSAVSREERQRGLAGLRELASAAGEGFVAVELGCLLAHKRTQQAQDFMDNTDYRNKCLAKVQTDRALSSRLCFADQDHKSGIDKQMDETNRRYYRKALTVLVNLIDTLFEETSPDYNFATLSPFFVDLLDLCQVGVIQPFYQGQQEISLDYFSSVKLQLKPVGAILSRWSERVSFITQKKHLRMLWNRNKRNAAYSFQQKMVEKPCNDESMLKDVSLIRIQHLKQVQGGAKSKVEDKIHSDIAIQEITARLCALFNMCDMSNPRFYKYEENLLGMLANYLRSSFSSTTQYLTIEMLFPIILLVKRQILQLSHPFLDMLDEQSQVIKRFSKKERARDEPLMATYPTLLCNLLLVVGGLLSNQKHIEKLLSAVFIKCAPFMEMLERYVQMLFQRNLKRQICRVLRFYRQCLQTYNQRKLRNQESKSIKTLFNHLTSYFYPKVGCLALKLQSKQEIIASGDGTPQEQALLHQLLEFVKDVFYYCQDELAEPMLEQQIASFYLKFAFFNFIKLYSTLTVAQLLSLQSEVQPATKESPHVSRVPPINTVFMIDLLRIISSIAVNRTHEVARKIKQYRIVEFFVRQFELEFEVTENIQKYIRKVARPKEVPPKKQPEPISKGKVPSLNLKSQKFKTNKTVEDNSHEQRSDGKGKKLKVVPSLKLPTRSDRSEQQRGTLDDLIDRIKEPKIQSKGLQLNLQLVKLNFDKKQESNAKSSERDLIYSSERKIRKIYSNRMLHCQAILLVLSMLLHKGLLDPEYCDQFPIAHGKVNVLYVLHHHLNEQSNKSVIPVLAEAVGRIKPFLSGQRLLKLLCTSFTDLSHYNNWKKISAGAYGVIYGCQTNLQSPKDVAIKQMSFPKSIYQRSVLHDIFTEITCLENFRLDQRITTMYNYGVVSHAYVIVMKKYDCSLRDWITLHKDSLQNKLPILLRIFWQILQTLLLLHQKSVTHYDIKADNVLLQFNPGQEQPCRVVLGDFGECRIFDQGRDEVDMKSRGTECIKSPQMLTLAIHLKKEADNYDRRKKIGTTRASDVWSLGCLFYQILTGQYLFHRADWVSFYVQVTSPAQEVLDKASLQRLTKYQNMNTLVEFLRTCLVRDHQHRPEIRGVMQKFRDLFGEHKDPPQESKSPLVVQRDLQQLVNRYLEEIVKHDGQAVGSSSARDSEERQSKEGRILGVKFMNSFNNAKSNKFMRVMEDIFFCESVALAEGGYQKIKQLKITHIVTTLKHPLLSRFNTLIIGFEQCGLAGLAFRLAPKISDFLRQVLLLKGKLLFINDQSNYATNLLIYTLSYWFRCSVYETWCLINTQILLFPTFTSDLQSLSTALRILNDVEQRVQQLPKLQCICGSVTFILKELTRSKKRPDINCRCKKKKIGEVASTANGQQCISTGCQNYLDFVKKRYSIAWESIKWASFNINSLLTSATPTKAKDGLKTQVLLNASEPWGNMVQVGSCVRGFKVMVCKVCEMMMMGTTDNKEQVLLVMNNMLRRIRQGIMIPNAQESFAKKTPALSYYTLTKLHMTKNVEQ